ncbi:DinB family protein [Calidifontibacter sp. DB0510]|uniref:DinB family protein n=1 Tax=Metallococcus carri TaxID=1656884 RepID=A0A967EDI2_9MICO|nr:DinB family protein [Metallococcus carri]NHN54751.1 DinB family protein [Metallococcus carri]NOP37096.1 DinB family protein [Calidifontibacter sp. DB2511S]
MTTEQKAVWQRYYRERREALISKVEDLSEYEARRPRTPTGTNLIGIIKHVLNVEAIYLGATFGRPFPHPEELVADDAYDADPQADWYATADETVAGIIDLYRRVITHCEQTVEQLDLDAVGHVRHWGSEQVTLELILVHNFNDLSQHNGQADILREQVDGSAGWRGPGDNVPDGYDWPAYVAKLTELAEMFRD